MFVLPTSYNSLYGYINDKTILLHQNVPDIVSQKISLFGAYGTFGPNLSQNYSALCFMIRSKDFFSTMAQNRKAKVILTLVFFFQKLFCGANGPKGSGGRVGFRGRWKSPQVRTMASFDIKEMFCWVVGIW